jgi:hypothetical protein
MNNRNVVPFLLAVGGLFAVAAMQVADLPQPGHKRFSGQHMSMPEAARPSHLPIGTGTEGDDEQLAQRLQASQDLLNLRELFKHMLEEPEKFNQAGKKERLEAVLRDRDWQKQLKDPEVAQLLRNAMDNPNLTEEQRRTLHKKFEEMSPDEWKKLADLVQRQPQGFTISEADREKLKQLTAQMQEGQLPEKGSAVLEGLLKKLDENPNLEAKYGEALKRALSNLPAPAEPSSPGIGSNPLTRLPDPIKPEISSGQAPLAWPEDKSAAPAVASGSADDVKNQLADWFADTITDDARAEYMADLIRQIMEGDGGDDSFVKEVLGKSIDWLGTLRPGEWLPMKQAKSAASLFDNLNAPKTPNFSGSSALLPGAGSMNIGLDTSSLLSEEMARAILWGAAAAVVGAAVWLLTVRYRAFLAARGKGFPDHWPVRPGEVMTRGDLVRAFEYLALLCLGIDAKHRHHLDLADRLGGPEHPADDSRRLAAQHLAYLYELARYAPEDESLPEAEMAAARRDLSFLAGAGAA